MNLFLRAFDIWLEQIKLLYTVQITGAFTLNYDSQPFQDPEIYIQWKRTDILGVYSD